MDRVTKPQKKMLINLLRETKYMEGKKEKEWYWEKIQAALNTIGPKKTIIQWKKCWRDMRLTTRKKLAELKRCQLAGGSPPPGIELNQEDNDIIDIVGTEYFYEEMNGELKPESFMSGFDYVPEHFCDAILTAAAVTNGQQQQIHQKDQQHSTQQSQQEHHTNDTETNEGPGSSDHTDSHSSTFQQPGISQIQGHNGNDHGPSSSQQHNAISQHPPFHGSLHPHLFRRQQQSAALQRETAFEEKLLQLMQDAFPKRSRKRKGRDPDRLFLLSLYDEIKRVPEDIRLDVKAELIQVLKKYQKKTPSKQERPQSQSSTSTKSSGANDKVQLHSQLPHSMYQLQKKYEKNEKEQSPTQAQLERVQHHAREPNASSPNVPLHPSQQLPHSLFQLQKKYEDPSEKVHQQQQNEQQRKHVEATHQQQQHNAHQQPPPPPPSNEQHLHHPQMTHSIMFPLPQIRTEPPNGTQQHHPHNPHQQQSQQLQHQPQAQQHHPPIFGATGASSMTADRPSMSYESVG